MESLKRLICVVPTRSSHTGTIFSSVAFGDWIKERHRRTGPLNDCMTEITTREAIKAQKEMAADDYAGGARVICRLRKTVI